MHLVLIYNGHFKNKKEIKIPIIFFLFGLIGYENNSYIENFENKKSIIGYCFFINKAVIS